MNKKILEEDFETINSTINQINVLIFKSGDYLREMRKNPLAFKKKILEDKENAFMIRNGFTVANIDYDYIELRLPHPVVPEYDMAKLKLQIYDKECLEYLATKLEELQTEDNVAVIIGTNIRVSLFSSDVNGTIEIEGTFYDIYKCEHNTNITIAKDFRDYYHIIDIPYFENYKKEYEAKKETKEIKNNSNNNESISLSGCLFWIIIIIIIILYFSS